MDNHHEGSFGWRPPTRWADQTGQRRDGDPEFRATGDMIDVRMVQGIPDNVLYVVTPVGAHEIRDGETINDAYLRLGRAMRVELPADQ